MRGAENPWLRIPLGEYEEHMEDVRQVEPLAQLFGEALAFCRPRSVAVLGVAGGNGLERIDPELTTRIVGIDVSGPYLQAVRERYRPLSGLELYQLDLEMESLALAPVEMVHAALVFEHTGVGRCLDNAIALVAPGGRLSVVLQEAPAGASRFESIRGLREGFSLLDSVDLRRRIEERGFELLGESRKGVFWMGIFGRPQVLSAPRFSTGDAVRLARELYGLDASADPLPSERDQNFRLQDASGARFVLKIANAEEALEVLDLQNRALKFLGASDTGLEWPRVIPALSGNEIAGAASSVRLFSWVEGVCFAEAKLHGAELLASLGRGLAKTDAALARFSHDAARRTHYWDLRNAGMARRHTALLTDKQRRIVEPVIDACEAVDWAALPASIIHGDANDYNILVRGGQVAAILDLGDMVHTATVCDLAIALAYVMLDEQDPVAAAASVVEAYHRERPLSNAEIDALFPLAAGRLAMSVCYCAWQARQAPDNEYLKISNRPAWALLERLAQMSAGWPTEVLHRACEGRVGEGLAARRRQHLGPSLSLSYREPLHIIRGCRQYLYDAAGHAYLDCVNNVAHVGHSHPRVVEAASKQMARLNTNTRYLDGNLVEYCERLTAMLPAPLSVVYLVCSGSEANELALRIARAHTESDNVVVMETAYHGNTNALIDISPYKFGGPGGRGKPAHVQVVNLQSEIDSPEGCPTFFCESALSCAGQVILPPGFLRRAYAAVHAAGGVCVADEVQTGFGRAGSHFWMFETQGVVPDIVTLGKPIGNGHPMGAVITTPEIAASFANGMEYFNTFGGNPVSCAVGLAVLDVIRDEGLQENARVVGGHLILGLKELARHHPVITDVRGLGLFLGFEMSGAEEASELVNRMKELGVLLSTDGPLHNVIKIKPPMIFSRADADLLLDRLERVLP